VQRGKTSLPSIDIVGKKEISSQFVHMRVFDDLWGNSKKMGRRNIRPGHGSLEGLNGDSYREKGLSSVEKEDCGVRKRGPDGGRKKNAG